MIEQPVQKPHRPCLRQMGERNESRCRKVLVAQGLSSTAPNRDALAQSLALDSLIMSCNSSITERRGEDRIWLTRAGLNGSKGRCLVPLVGPARGFSPPLLGGDGPSTPLRKDSFMLSSPPSLAAQTPRLRHRVVTLDLTVRTVRPSLLDHRFSGDPWIVAHGGDTHAVCLGNYPLAWIEELSLDLPSLNRLFCALRRRPPRKRLQAKPRTSSRTKTAGVC